MLRSSRFVLAALACCAGPAAAQENRDELLKSAREKFVRDIKRIESNLLDRIDRELTKKSTEKDLAGKLNYERPRFVTHHIVPTALPGATVTYLQDRTKATNALREKYDAVIKELVKAKKLTEQEAVEDELSELLKASRGYGLAFPDLEMHPGPYMIVNKELNLAIDYQPQKNDRTCQLVLSPRSKGAVKPGLCWAVERDERGFVFWNVESKQCFDLPFGKQDLGQQIYTFPRLKTEEFTPNQLFPVIEVRREFMIRTTTIPSSSDELVLTPFEKSEKGVVRSIVVQQQRFKVTSASQLWQLIPVK
jgi:hypothetical protein